MSFVTQDNLTQVVVDSIKTDNERFRQVFSALTRHVHAFAHEVDLTLEEWFAAIDFLTRTGQKCDDKRQEFVLLSDMFGLSALVDMKNDKGLGSATETAVLGPFHAKALPMEMGAMIALGPEAERGRPAVVSGKVTDSAGNPIEGALIDVWHSDDAGFYDVQDATLSTPNLRGIFKTGADGTYWFRTIKPCAYPVPTDGPVGELLRAAGRHAMRPAHIHFKLNAPGYNQLVTQVYSADSDYLDSDAVFGVKESLVQEYTSNDSSEEAAKHGFSSPFWEMSFDFVLVKAG